VAVSKLQSKKPRNSQVMTELVQKKQNKQLTRSDAFDFGFNRCGLCSSAALGSTIQ